MGSWVAAARLVVDPATTARLAVDPAAAALLVTGPCRRSNPASRRAPLHRLKVHHFSLRERERGEGVGDE